MKIRCCKKISLMIRTRIVGLFVLLCLILVFVSCYEASSVPTIDSIPQSTNGNYQSLEPTNSSTVAVKSTINPIISDECFDKEGDIASCEDINEQFTHVEWFIGPSIGTEEQMIKITQSEVDEFHKQNEDIFLEMNDIPTEYAYGHLLSRIEVSSPPDIIGPINMEGISFLANYTQTKFDVENLINRKNIDLSEFDEYILQKLKKDGKQIALPYSVYPSVIFFNKQIFDKANMPYPPQRFGALYQGKEWNMDTLRDLAMKLTLDKDGNNAFDEHFDPLNIVQFGFGSQWMDCIRCEGSLFGAGSLMDSKGHAQIPDLWQDGWKWFYKARHIDHFIPNDYYINNILSSNSTKNIFSSGRIAMVWSQMWYECCLNENNRVNNWDIAVIPSYKHKTTIVTSINGFTIISGNKNPETVFDVYYWIYNNPDLRSMYGGVPANKRERVRYFSQLDQNLSPNKINWQVVSDSLQYPDIPSYDLILPNSIRVEQRLEEFRILLHSNSDLDISSEAERLSQDLEIIFNAK
jgi:multiple sugar transport system substrate-binding protein